MHTELTCEQTLPMLSDYFDGLLDAETSESVWRHLQECDTCMEEYETLDKMLFLLGSVPEVPVPAAVNTRLKAALRNEPAVKLHRRTRFRLQVGALAAVFTVGLFTYWIYDNADKGFLTDSSLDWLKVTKRPVSTSELPQKPNASGGSDVNNEPLNGRTTPGNEPAAIGNEVDVSSKDNVINEKVLPEQNITDSGTPTETPVVRYPAAEAIIGPTETEAGSNPPNNTTNLTSSSNTSAVNTQSDREAVGSSGNNTNGKTQSGVDRSDQMTKPRVLVPEVTLYEMLSKLPEKTSDSVSDKSDKNTAAAEGAPTVESSPPVSDVLTDTSSPRESATDSVSESSRSQVEQPSNSSEKGPIAVQGSPVANEPLIQQAPSYSQSAIEPSSGSISLSSPLQSAQSSDGADATAVYEKQLKEKLKGCKYRVLFVDAEGNKKVYRVRLMSNVNGAVIDQELEFVYDSTGAAIYYAEKPDTMQ